MKITLKILLLVAVVFIASVPAPVDALTFNVDFPAITIPGAGDVDLNCMAGADDPNCSTGIGLDLTLGMLILFIFGLFIWIGGLVAFVALIYTGFSYALSGASPQIRNKAKERMKNVFIGLGILLFSTIILNVINPDIGDLEQADMTEQREGLMEAQPTLVGDFIEFVGRVFTGDDAPEVGENGGSSPSSPGSWPNHSAREPLCTTGQECVQYCGDSHQTADERLRTESQYINWPGMWSADNVVNINDLGLNAFIRSTARNPDVADNQEFINALRRADDSLSGRGCSVNLTSGYRPLYDQARVLCWGGGRNANPSAMDSAIGYAVATPGMSNHGYGTAIDVHGVSGCGIEEIQQAFFSADPGWYVLNHEYWHFEYWGERTPPSNVVRERHTRTP